MQAKDKETYFYDFIRWTKNNQKTIINKHNIKHFLIISIKINIKKFRFILHLHQLIYTQRLHIV